MTLKYKKADIDYDICFFYLHVQQTLMTINSFIVSLKINYIG